MVFYVISWIMLLDSALLISEHKLIAPRHDFPLKVIHFYEYMKSIFLDIDGVLATEESSCLGWHEEFAYPFDIEWIMVLNEILNETSAEIIFTSNWRLCFNNDLQLIDRLFKHNGIRKSPINITQNLNNRGEEITSYIKTHNVHSFVILMIWI